MAFWNRNKHKHSFGKWIVFKEFEITKCLKPWEISMDVEPIVIGTGFYQKRSCIDCGFTQLDKQEIVAQ